MTATSQQRPRSKSFGDRVRDLRERARQEAGLDYQLLRLIIFSSWASACSWSFLPPWLLP